MEAPAENKKGLSNKVIIIAAAVIIALLAAVVVLLLTRPAPTDIGDEGVPKIGYATEATVLLDQNSLQAAMDEAMANAKDGNIGLYYQTTRPAVTAPILTALSAIQIPISMICS